MYERDETDTWNQVKFQPTRKLWIGTQPDPDNKFIAEVSEADYQRIAAAKGTNQVIAFTDALTLTPYRVQYTDCGADCHCALKLVRS